MCAAHLRFFIDFNSHNIREVQHNKTLFLSNKQTQKIASIFPLRFHHVIKPIDISMNDIVSKCVQTIATDLKVTVNAANQRQFNDFM